MTMESELNCSSQCDSQLCFVHSGVNKQEGLDILQRLCTVSTMRMELPKRSLSPVLCAVVWTLLSCGILLALCFLLFTLRFKNNRIVKMSSPNLNVLTLCGSVLTYSSGFLFAIDERTFSQGGESRAVLQARMWTLCIGSTLVFGPILGKTWRLYRVFTQRVPDKRVIIRDIQLMGMVGLLISVDMLLLAAWNLTDPIRCSRSIGAVVKVVGKEVSYSLSQLDSCSSVYSNLWVILIAVLKGCLLLYGTYLAGLTSNVSHPPVNQSPTIISAVSLVTLSTAVAVPVSVFLQAWPNLVYSSVAGAIFICTLATNCLLFVPQLTQWRQFEEEHNNPSQMAKYFSSPSKSQPSIYSQDEIYYLLGENNSMKKLLTEKNAVIDSLQEQVNNAKDKLLHLMSAMQPSEDQETDSSATNLNSCSTQTTAVQSEGSSTPLHQREAQSFLSSLASSPLLSPDPTDATTRSTAPPIPEPPPAPTPISTFTIPTSSPPLPGSSAMCPDVGECGEVEHGFLRPMSSQSSGLPKTGYMAAGETIPTSPSNYVGNKLPAETLGCRNNRRFVSSEQLQEILQELSVDAAVESTLRSPGQVWVSQRPSQLNITDTSPISPLSLRAPRSPHLPLFFQYPSISPYAMRKRRPPFHSPRGGPSACFYLGSDTLSCVERRSNGEVQKTDKHPSKMPPQPDRVAAAPLHLDHADIKEEEEDSGEEEDGAAEHPAMRRCRRCVSGPRRCSRRSPAAPSDAGASGERGPFCRPARDSCGSWDSDSSSSTDYCYYHRPYCDSCLQRGSLLSSDSSSDSSDSEYGDLPGLYRSPHPVVFKEDLKPTFV
ncbi:probable G-protein coupled receptor 156 isoform X1 [Lampris incognitus]|uniref:probable G-protein coupled receptor 156 isoform X1 n=1 Tax=Lampris incognitus TaxID=2546036 RepID=UPI0024B5BCF8|nr:probable G-protein coupled receptor 156 isoform X1 [Lampris incognitus]